MSNELKRSRSQFEISAVKNSRICLASLGRVNQVIEPRIAKKQYV
jgi:hypothetical protein